MWIRREMVENIKRVAAQRPAVLLTGARQTGKTSLLRHLFPKHRYVSLDLPYIAQEAQEAGESFLKRYPPPVILDEVQYAPGLFRYIKHAIDQKRGKMGQYFLTGSQQFGMMEGVSESLAGRVAILQCHPLSSRELARAPRKTWGRHSLLQQMSKGSYPEIQASNLDAYEFYADYVATYLQRDLRQIAGVKNLRSFDTLMRLCATRCGQLLSYASLAGDVGVGVDTIKNWLSALQAGHLIHLLQPYYKNLGKRLVKSPKVYFCDTGLACFLAGIRSIDDLQQSPLLGSIFENHVFNQIVCHFCNRGRATDVYFYRDHRGHEVDFVVPMGGKLRLIECKMSSTPTVPAGLGYLANLLGKSNVSAQAVITPQRSNRPLPNSGVVVDNCVDLRVLKN